MSAPPSKLELELREQASALAARTEPGWEHAASAAALIARDDVDHVVIAARGSSDNAARYAQYLLGAQMRLPVALATPWLYSSEAPPLLRRAAVIAISQSGRSPDIVAVAAAAAAQGRPTIAITNDLDSPLADAADVAVPLLTGPERSVAATKTYLASLHAIAQIAHCLRPGLGGRDWFERLPGEVERLVGEQLSTREQFDPLARVELVTAVGRGLQFPTACETALKLRELSAIPAEAFSLPDLLHGPVAALGSSGAVWVISTQGRHQPDREAFTRLAAAGGLTVVVSDRDELLAAAQLPIPMAPGLPEWVAPFLAVIPAQAAGLRLAELRGVDVDRPPGLRKVTLTT